VIAMTREQAQGGCAQASAERDTIQANLLDLDGSFGKRLLAGATLSGRSAAQWETASAGLASLWDMFAAYSSVLDRAAELLNQPGRLPAARLDEACELLTGPSVRLARATTPLSQRELTSGAEVRLSLTATVLEMKRSFTEIAAVLTAAESVWNEISDGLRDVTDALDGARRQAAESADAELTGAIAQAGDNLRELRDQLNADPLALWNRGQVDTARLDRLREQAAAVSARAGELARLRDGAGQRIAEVAATVSAARQAWQDAMAARSRAATRVVIVTESDPLPDVSGLAGRLAELTALRDSGRWTRLQSELDLLGKQAATALRQCQEAERAAAGLIGQRDELRGLLDAYRAKAARLSGVEDQGLDSLYRKARDLLWSAPCELDAATAAVTGYQQAILERGRSGGR